MKNKTEFESFIGKEVKIYPGDTYKKRGILTEINEYGFLFKITYADDNAYYKVGESVFISRANMLTLTLHENK